METTIKINKEITHQLEATGNIDIFALYQAVQPTSTYNLLNTVFDVLESHQPELNNQIFLAQAKAVLGQLSNTLDENQVIQTLCNKLSVMETANVTSRYIQTTDCHQYFGNKADVVMFGDSITDWGLWHEMFPEIKIVNRGIAGDNTKGMLRRIETTLQLEPNQVFVMAGINDLAQGCSVDDVFNRYMTMLDIWQQHNIKPVVQSTLYTGARIAFLNPYVTELNALLLETCQSRGITFVDVTSELCPNQYLPQIHSCDDLHLNATAYQKWRGKIEHLMNAYVTNEINDHT